MRSRKAGRTRRPKEFARRDSERTSRELEVHPCAENVQHSKRTSSRREKEDWRADESGRRPTSKRGVEPHRELISLARQRIRRGRCADPVKDLRLDSFGPLQSLVWAARHTRLCSKSCAKISISPAPNTVVNLANVAPAPS